MRIFIFTLSALIGFFLLLCCRSKPVAERPEVVSISRVIDKTSRDSELCRSFTLSKENVATYFLLANEVDASDFDQEAMILPCKYQGTLKKSGHLYQWEIIAGGAGYLYDTKVDKRFICREKCLDALPNVRGP